MQLDDRVTISTPEGIELELQLAGLASRFIAGSIDLMIQLLLIIGVAIVLGVTLSHTTLNEVVLVLALFVIWFFYWILFELLARGRTPGKMLTHLRVVRDTGAPVDLPASAIRNLVRVVDGPLLSWLPTIICIAVSRRNQRPGDMAAGTLVIREAPRRARSGRGRRRGLRRGVVVARPPLSDPLLGGASGLPAWDLTAITAEELATIRLFLERRDSLERVARHELAARLAAGMARKAAGSPSGGDPEKFLETLVELKSRRG